MEHSPTTPQKSVSLYSFLSAEEKAKVYENIIRLHYEFIQNVGWLDWRERNEEKYNGLTKVHTFYTSPSYIL